MGGFMSGHLELYTTTDERIPQFVFTVKKLVIQAFVGDFPPFPLAWLNSRRAQAYPEAFATKRNAEDLRF
jgi:hypothetical protein